MEGAGTCSLPFRAASEFQHTYSVCTERWNYTPFYIPSHIPTPRQIACISPRHEPYRLILACAVRTNSMRAHSHSATRNQHTCSSHRRPPSISNVRTAHAHAVLCMKMKPNSMCARRTTGITRVFFDPLAPGEEAPPEPSSTSPSSPSHSIRVLPPSGPSAPPAAKQSPLGGDGGAKGPVAAGGGPGARVVLQLDN